MDTYCVVLVIPGNLGVHPYFDALPLCLMLGGEELADQLTKIESIYPFFFSHVGPIEEPEILSQTFPKR